MKGKITIALDEKTRNQLRIIRDEKYDGQEVSFQETIDQLVSEEVAELMETREAIEAKQEDLAESFGNGDTTSSKESTSDDSEVASKQAEVASKMFNGGK